MQQADQLPEGDVQFHGGVLADASPVAGWHTTAQPLPFPPRRETPSSMSSPGPVSTLSPPPSVRDRALWDRARTLVAQHPQSASDDRCANPRCDNEYPCIPARTAARLKAASTGPFHQRMTALIDARSCEVVSPEVFGPPALTPIAGRDHVAKNSPFGGYLGASADTMALVANA